MSLKEHPKVNEWLTCVEKEMRVTLASLLAEAMKDVSLFQSENIDSQKYLEWVDKYQVIQVAIFLQSVLQYYQAKIQKHCFLSHNDLSCLNEIRRCSSKLCVIHISILFQAQLVVLACQVSWSQYTEAALQKGDVKAVQQVLRVVEATLNVLADSVLHEQPAVRRRKLEHLVSFKTIFYLNCDDQHQDDQL